jgi:hypothetical protein
MTPLRSAAGRNAAGVSWATLQEDPSRLLDQYRIDFCLLSQASPMVRAMRYLPGWREQYSDSHAVIFVRSGAR